MFERLITIITANYWMQLSAQHREREPRAYNTRRAVPPSIVRYMQATWCCSEHEHELHAGGTRYVPAAVVHTSHHQPVTSVGGGSGALESYSRQQRLRVCLNSRERAANIPPRSAATRAKKVSGSLFRSCSRSLILYASAHIVLCSRQCAAVDEFRPDSAHVCSRESVLACLLLENSETFSSVGCPLPLFIIRDACARLHQGGGCSPLCSACTPSVSLVYSL
ncbi:unnamed protein product [Trichogramma brassicae]|uniref:Uncharacterized protein n=1 Tax=Trichogramma brassicae TaxID=86971 RepID=A0A6H5J256_9HYME|nr:unnamed protein product [Trichogramma brassicae]